MTGSPDYEVLRTAMMELADVWERAVGTLDPEDTSGWLRKEFIRSLRDDVRRVDDRFDRSVETAAERLERELESANMLIGVQAGNIEYYQSVLIDHFFRCDMESEDPNIRTVIKAAKDLGAEVPQLALWGVTETELAEALTGHAINGCVQDSGSHCYCGSDSRFVQTPDWGADNPWSSIQEHYAQVVLALLRKKGLIGE